MSNAMQEAIEEAVVRIKSNGTVLDVKRLAAAQGGAGPWAQEEVALALMEAASRRQVVMEFHPISA